MSEQRTDHGIGTGTQTPGADDTYASRPWLRHYPAGAPADIESPTQVIPDFLRSAAERYPDRVAVAYYGRAITFRQLDRLSDQFANRLIEHGLQRGDPVIVILA